MEFLPFPRGAAARGTSDGMMVVGSEFLNCKQQRLLDVLHGESELCQVLVGTELVSKAVKRCVRVKDKTVNLPPTLGRRLDKCEKLALFARDDLDALRAVCKIRNTIGHADFAVTLTDSEVATEMRVLTNWLQLNEYKWMAQTRGGTFIPGWTGSLIGAGENLSGHTVERQTFLGAVVMLYVGLANIQWAIDPTSYKGMTVVGN